MPLLDKDETVVVEEGAIALSLDVTELDGESDVLHTDKASSKEC